MDTHLSNKNSPPITYKKGSIFVRFCALVIDSIIVVAVSCVLSLILKVLALIFVLAPFFGAIFIWKFGATPGKKLLKLKVVSSSYKPINFGFALLRETIGKFISGLFFCFGYFWVIIDKKNQAWHDKIARTLVVRLDKAGKLIPAEQKGERVSIVRKVCFVFIYLVIGFPIIFLVLHIFFFRPFQIAGNSMYPNYFDGQYYLINITNRPKFGDVIVFKAPNDPEKGFVKRVIGVPGDQIMVGNGNVYLNGKVLDESKYLKPMVKSYMGSFLKGNLPLIIPLDSYFVMGDNRSGSSDSREWGFLPSQNIVGKIVLCYFKCNLSAK